HCIGHRPLWNSKFLMSAIRPAPCIQPFRDKRLVYRLEISRRKDTVTVKYDKVIAPGMYKTEIPRRPRPAVRFNVIPDRQAFFIRVDHLLRCDCGAVLDQNNLKILTRLRQET